MNNKNMLYAAIRSTYDRKRNLEEMRKKMHLKSNFKSYDKKIAIQDFILGGLLRELERAKGIKQMEKLKRCPFCGGEAMIEDWTCAYEIGTSIRCSTCGAAIHEGIEDGNGCHDRAVKAWNRRAQENPQPLTLEELQEMDGEPVWVMVVDHKVFADKDDDFDGWGMCRKSWARLWDKERADLIHVDYDFEDYGKTWLAYRTKPEGSGDE